MFEQWVRDGLQGRTGKSDTSGFSDADCRMTVMLLAYLMENNIKESADELRGKLGDNNEIQNQIKQLADRIINSGN